MTNSLSTYFDNLFDEFRPVSILSKVTNSAPALNVKELNDCFEISLMIPGIDPSKVKVEINNKILTFNYKHEEKNDSKNKNGEMIRQEYFYYNFSRSISLPQNTEDNSVMAESENGVLTVKINKSPETKGKTIEVKNKPSK